jgi:riboflavin synthase
MYTGIIQGTFPVIELERKPDLTTYAVELEGEMSQGLAIGASVSIEGVCQTVTDISGSAIRFEAIRETLDLTTLDALEVGQLVAVERSAKVGDEVGGHDVAGHVSGTGVVAEVDARGDVFDMAIEVPLDWTHVILEKGFIAVDGSSLTVGEVVKGKATATFALHLIPETLRLTNLGKKNVGDRVNIEFDSRTVAIVKTVERVLEARADGGS